MNNEGNQDAEHSATAEKAAIESSDTPAAAAQASAPETSTPETPASNESQAPADEPVAAAPEPAAEAAPEAAPAEAPSEAAPQMVAPETPQPAPVQTAAPETPPPPAPIQAAPAPAPPAVEDSQAPGDIDFGAILEQFEQDQTLFQSGQMVKGTVVGITDRGVLVDFGYKSEGFVPPEELTGPDGKITVSVGEEIDVVIRAIHSGDAAPQLSRIDALGRKVWDDLEAAFQAETPVTGKIVDKTKGGLKIDLNGVEAFLPGSQIDSRPIRSLDSYIGQEIEAKIIKFSRRRNNIVLSRKVITDEVVNAQKAETLSKIDVGYIVEGTIKNLTEYGAFVDIGGIDGLLHVTDMSWGRVHHPADLFKVGDHLQVKVLKLDREKEKISLGYKQLLPDPWSTVVEVYPVNTKLKGTVSSVTDYGVFVELEPGVEGLVHVSEISWSRRAQSPKRIFHKGQEVEVQVLGVDTVEKRISLGMKQFLENPWDLVQQKYPVGTKVHGRVRNLTDFGAFIELEEGIDGLVHVSDISWGKKVRHPKDVLKKDQEVDAVVTNIDRAGQRLSLSIKDLTPSEWEGFVATHRPGDVVRGKVSRFTNFGVFVELGEGLEGLCHISELSDERVDRPESIAELGQEMDFKILRIEPGEQKIGLSHRAVGKDEEPTSADTRVYSSEAKGGMASLGELANLKLGSAAEPAAEEAPKENKKSRKQEKAREAAAEAATPAADDAPAMETPAEATVPEPATTEEQAAQTAPETAAEQAPIEVEEVAPESGDATGAGEPATDAATDTAAEADQAPAGEETGETPTENAPEPASSDEPKAESIDPFAAEAEPAAEAPEIEAAPEASAEPTPAEESEKKSA
jgi:small subunit ribosomal protein S1